MGSPPLARGTGKAEEKMNAWYRITPACAGNSDIRFSVRNSDGDHPRLRGEQSQLHRRDNHLLGSPPLARGTGFGGQTAPRARRITPACAGNSRAAHQSRGHGGDHPRLRGEQGRTIVCKVEVLGSPPLARGTELYLNTKSPACRITPACAGNREEVIYTIPKEEDHPRLRGEQHRHIDWCLSR